VEPFPLNFTDIAKERLASALADEPDGTFVRIHVEGGGCAGWKQLLKFDQDFDPEEDIETSFSVENDHYSILGSEPYSIKEATLKTVKVVVDSFSALYLKDTTLDFVSEKFKEGFSFVGGQKTKTCACGSSVGY
jgi:iron-sulfur cluster assembly protein